jgi:plasmid maintenance system killer protein
MTVEYADAVIDSLESASAAVKRAFKQARLLEQDLRHPSLRAKKYDERNDLWQARVNRDWRFYFSIAGDTYRILKLIPHPK